MRWWLALGLLVGGLRAQEPAGAPAPTPLAPPAQAAPVLTGAELFKERGCVQCHAMHGAGGHKGPDLSTVGKRLKPEAIRSQIAEGGGAMPAYADALGDGELDKLVEFLRKQRK